MGKEVGGDVEEAAEEPEDLLHTSDQNENSGDIRACEEEFNSIEELRNHVRSHLVESEPGEPNQFSPCKKNFETRIPLRISR